MCACICVYKYVYIYVYVCVCDGRAHSHGVHVRPEDSLQVSVTSSAVESRESVQVVRPAHLPISLVVLDFLFCVVLFFQY